MNVWRSLRLAEPEVRALVAALLGSLPAGTPGSERGRDYLLRIALVPRAKPGARRLPRNKQVR